MALITLWIKQHGAVLAEAGRRRDQADSNAAAVIGGSPALSQKKKAAEGDKSETTLDRNVMTVCI